MRGRKKQLGDELKFRERMGVEGVGLDGGKEEDEMKLEAGRIMTDLNRFSRQVFASAQEHLMRRGSRDGALGRGAGGAGEGAQVANDWEEAGRLYKVHVSSKQYRFPSGMASKHTVFLQEGLRHPVLGDAAHM